MLPSLFFEDRCSYVSPVDGWKCKEPAWSGSKNGFCIGHDGNPGKPPKVFLQTLQKKFRSRDYYFDGFVFPYCLTIKNILTDKTVSFLNCQFLQGIRFENCRFGGPLTTFENCMFGGDLLYFHLCHFEGETTSFANSVFNGDLLAFHRCRFDGDAADFSGVKWRASRRITYVYCTLNSRIFSYRSSRLESPNVIYRGGTLGASDFQIHDSTIESDYLAFTDTCQTRGIFSVERSTLNCARVQFAQGNWSGDGLRFSRCRWNGDRFSLNKGNTTSGLTMDRCQLDGNRIDFSGLCCQGEGYRFNQTNFHAKEDIDFSHISVYPRGIVQECEFSCKRLSFKRLRSDGDEWSFQKNTIKAESANFQQSFFHTNRLSLNRSTIQSRTIDFRLCSFQNKQTSFQSCVFIGRRASFANSHFDSERISFHFSRFSLAHLCMDGVDFGRGTTSFWKTHFGKTSVTLKNAVDRGARCRFFCNVSTVSFEGSHLNDCDFTEAEWKYIGWLKRPRLADEQRLIEDGRFEELRRLYRWISDQYTKRNMQALRDDFLYSCREMDRLERIRNGTMGERVDIELSRWTTGYNIGFSRSAIIRGVSSLFSLCLLYLIRYR